MANIKIENVVASGSLGDSLNLEAIIEADALVGAEYEPNTFPGMVYRQDNPKTAVLLFSSGKIVCTGAKNLEQVRQAISKVAERIKRAGIEIKEDPEIEIQNIVAFADLEVELNMNAICMSMGLENVEYEPEQFPGLVYRMDDPKAVLLLFSSGKVVCTGAKSPEDIERAVEKLSEELRRVGQL